jgi:hypothetical protein
VLYRPTTDRKQDRLHHHCRNLHCRDKLTAPVKNPRDSFCCHRCHDTFYRQHCRVCENALAGAGPAGNSAHKMLCDRSSCRAEYRSSPASFWGGRYPTKPISVKRTQNSPIESKPKSTLFDDRPFRQVAGPDLTRRSFNAATVPDGPDGQWKGGTFERIEAENRRLLERHFAQLSTAIAIAAIEAAKTTTGIVDTATTDRLIASFPADLSIPEFLKRDSTRSRDQPREESRRPCTDADLNHTRSLGDVEC